MSNNWGGGGWSYFNTELHLPVCVSISAFSGCDLSDSLSYFIHTCMMFNKKYAKLANQYIIESKVSQKLYQF